MSCHSFRSLFVALAMPIAAIGCTAEKPTHVGDGELGHGDHAHASVGPHGGELIELGEEEYHAEVVHGADVVIYVLDAAAKSPVAINATEVTLNLTHDGASEQFLLKASPQAQEAAGTSSKFQSSESELVSDLAEGHAEVQLVLSVNGKQYRGNLEHEHEEGHQH
jgi:hypothetical protein